MAVCTHGHENADTARSCTTCSLPVAPAATTGWGRQDAGAAPPAQPAAPIPGWGRPATLAPGWGAPTAPPPASPPPASPPPGRPAAPQPRRRRTGLVVGVAAALVLALCAGLAGLAAMGDGDEAEAPVAPPASRALHPDLSVVSTRTGDVVRLHLVRQGEPLGAIPAFGHGRVVPIGSEPHPVDPVPLGSVPADPGIVPVRGGAIVAWNDRGLVTVAIVHLGTPRPRVLFQGSDETGVGVEDDLDGDPVIRIEDGGHCFRSDKGRPALVVASGPTSCRFAPTGQIITGRPAGAGEQAFTLLGPRGEVIAAIEPSGASAEVRGRVVAVRREGSVVIADGTTGEPLHELEQGPLAGSGTTPHDGGLLVPTGQQGDLTATSAGIVRVTGTGQVVPVVDGQRVVARLGADGTIVAARDDGKRTTLVATGPRSGAEVALASAAGLRFELVPGPRDETHVLAWDRTGRVWFGPATDPLPQVGTIERLTGLHDISSVPGHPGVFAHTETLELVRIDADGVTTFPGVWSRIEVADASARGVLVVATRNDGPTGQAEDRMLLLVRGDDAEQLDRGAIEDPRFDGDAVVYEWRTPKAPVRDAQIRRVSVLGDAQPTTVQRHAAIALPWSPHPVWRAPSEGTRWQEVSGCGTTPAFPPGQGGSGPLIVRATGCLMAPWEPGVLRLQISCLRCTHVAIEGGGAVLAELDGPLDAHEVSVRTAGGPTLLRFTAAAPVPGEPPPTWLVDSTFTAER